MPEAAARPPRPKRRWPWLLLPPMLLVGGLLVALQTALVERLAREAAEEALSRLLGEELDIERIELSYLPLRLTVRGIRLTHPADGALVAEVAAVEASFGLAHWRPALLELVLREPGAELHLDADGLREFRGLPKGQKKTKLPERFPWERLVVEGGDFVLHVKDADLVEVHDLDLRPGEGGDRLSVEEIHLRFGAFERRIEPFAWDGLELAPDHLRIPALALRTAGLSLDGDLALGFAGEAPLGGDLSLHADLASLTTGKDPRKYVGGSVDVDLSLGGRTAAPELGGSLLAEGVTVHGINSKGEPFARAFGEVRGPFTYADRVLAAGPLGMRWDEARIGIDARLDTRDWTLGAGVTGEDLSLGQILRRVGVHPGPWVDFRGDVEVHVSGSTKPLALDGPFEVDLVDLDVTNGAFDSGAAEILAVEKARLAGTVHIDGRHFVIDADQVDFGPHSSARARADIGLKPEGPLLVEVDFSRLDLGELAPLGDAGLGGSARARGRLSGPFDALHAELDLDGVNLQVLDLLWADRFRTHLESPDLKRLQFSGIEAELGATRYQGNLELSFPASGMELDTQVYVVDGRVKDLLHIFTDLDGIDAGLTGTIVLGGPIYHMDGDIDLALAEAEIYGEPFTEGHATAWMDDGLFTLDELRLRREELGILARGTVGRGWAMDMELLSDGATVQRLAHLEGRDLPLRADLVLDARVGGTLRDWRPEGRIALRNTVFAGKNVAPSTIHFHTEPGEVLAWSGTLVGDSLRTHGSVGLHGDQPYVLDATFVDFPLDLLYPMGADGSPVTARLDGQLHLDGQFGDSPTPVEIEGGFTRVYAAWAGHELRNPQPWTFHMTGTEVTIDPVRLSDGAGTDISLDGQTSLTGFVHLQGGGTLDLDLVRAFAPGITEARGTAKLEIDVSGSRETGVDVEVAGTISRGEVKTEFFPEAFEEIDAAFIARPDGYSIFGPKAVPNFYGASPVAVDALSARVGGGQVLAHGHIDAEGWIPTRYDLHADVRDARVKYFESLPAMRGSAALRFDGPVDALQLGGKIVVADMTWSDRIPWEEWIVSVRGPEHLTASAEAERKDWFGFDLQVLSDHTVRMRNNVGDLDASVDLRVGGDTARPEMTGSITVDPGGLVYFNGRQLEVSRGEIR